MPQFSDEIRALTSILELCLYPRVKVEPGFGKDSKADSKTRDISETDIRPGTADLDVASSDFSFIMLPHPSAKFVGRKSLNFIKFNFHATIIVIRSATEVNCHCGSWKTELLLVSPHSICYCHLFPIQCFLNSVAQST